MDTKQASLHKELDLIQDVIKRMADNSFKVKVWTIGVLSGIVAFTGDSIFTGEKASIGLTATLLVPIFAFWYLDAFFLRTEQMYRKIYAWVVKNRPQNQAYLYDLNTFTRDNENLIKNIGSIRQIMFSKTLWPFYMVPAVFVIGLLLVVIEN